VDMEETLQQQPVGMAPGELAGGMNRPTRPPSGALECEEELGAWGPGAAQSVYAARHAPPPRTKWTRLVPHPVLIGHAASLIPY